MPLQQVMHAVTRPTAPAQSGSSSIAGSATSATCPTRRSWRWSICSTAWARSATRL